MAITQEKIDTLIGVAAKYKIDRPEEKTCCMGDCKMAWWALATLGVGILLITVEFFRH